MICRFRHSCARALSMASHTRRARLYVGMTTVTSGCAAALFVDMVTVGLGEEELLLLRFLLRVRWCHFLHLRHCGTFTVPIGLEDVAAGHGKRLSHFNA